MASPEYEQNLQSLLKAYFDNDDKSRFRLEKNVGSGQDAIAWRIGYRPTPNDYKRIVLKHAKEVVSSAADFVESDPEFTGVDVEDAGPEPKNQITIERQWLEVDYLNIGEGTEGQKPTDQVSRS